MLVCLSFTCNGQTFFKSIVEPNPFKLIHEATIAENRNHTYIAFTYSNNSGFDRLRTMLLDSVGNILRTQALHMPNFFAASAWEERIIADPTSDSTFIVANAYVDTSFHCAFSDKSDIVLTKIDFQGNIVWVKSIGNPTHHLMPVSVKTTNDKGVIVVGFRSDSIDGTSTVGADATGYVAKTDSTGKLIWSKGFDRQPGVDRLNAAVETAGGFVLAGITMDSVGNSMGCMIKVGRTGITIWRKAYSDPVRDIQALIRDNDFLVALCNIGPFYGSQISNDITLLKTDSNGVVVWAKQLHFNDTVVGEYVIRANDGGYIVLGYIANDYHSSDSNKCFLLKTDSAGNLQWCRRIGDYSNYGYWGHSLQQLSNGDLLVSGEYYNSTRVLFCFRTDSLGICPGLCEWSDTPTGSSLTVVGSDITFPEEIYADSSVALAFSLVSDSLRSVDSCSVGYLGLSDPVTSIPVNLYPNPTADFLNIEVTVNTFKVEVRNVFGALVLVQGSTGSNLKIDMGRFPRGFYTCSVRTLDGRMKTLGFILR